MNDNRTSPLATDFLLRSSSLVLFTVLIGLSIQFGIEKIIELKFEQWVLLNFLTFLVTAIRFFHGNYIYHEKPRGAQPIQFMVNFYFNVIELVALCVVGRLIDDGSRFLYALLLLGVIDIAWAVLSLSFKRFRNANIFWLWGALSLASAIFMILLIRSDYIAVGAISTYIFAFYILMAILDYSLGKNFYFGR